LCTLKATFINARIENYHYKPWMADIDKCGDEEGEGGSVEDEVQKRNSN